MPDDDPSDERVEVEPWLAVWSDSGTWPGQPERQEELRERIGATIGERVFIARGAAVVCDELTIGDRSFVAAGCLLRDRVEIGEDCSLNAHVTCAGRVTLGHGVRIASHAALYGFNHVFDDLDTPIWLQGLTEEGIVVEDDVWIGTHVVICDGVRIGAHSVIAAGAVVTHDVPPYSVAAGVPARVIRDRRDSTVQSGGLRSDALARFDAQVRGQWHAVVERCRATIEGAEGPVDGYLDSPGAPPTARATCDAVEIAGAFGAQTGLAVDIGTDPLVARLQALQDPVTGLFLDPIEGCPDDPLALRIGDEYHHYGVLSVGYALEVLGAAPLHPVHVVETCPADELVDRLDALPWDDLAWPAGSWVDFWGTATYLNARHHDRAPRLETLFGWLDIHLDRRSGLWGSPAETWGWLMPVNGFYRLTRGTYAQFGHSMPTPEATIDTVAVHCRDNGWFEERNRNACNVLDIVHPLWLCARQTDYRRPELRDQLAALLERTVAHWVDGEGFAFEDGQPTGLQGTEMWLSIVHLLAHYLDESEGLSWKPRGVHRLEPAAAVG